MKPCDWPGCRTRPMSSRWNGPSLSGRLLRRVPGVQTYTQHARWADDAWTHLGSVFDAFAPGPSADMPVNFFVDPAPTKDVNMDDVKTITLSYTFFRAKDQPKDQKAQPTRTSAAPQAPRPVN